MIVFEELCKNAREVVAKSVGFIRMQSREFDLSAVEKKGFNDLVSFVDKTSEEMLVDGLEKLLPGSGFITEENTAGESGERFRWVIDPLDGTTNFVHGVPCYCVSVALLDGDELVMGIVHEVNLDECFYSWKGADAFMNGIKIRVSKINKLSDSLIVTGFPYTDFSRMDSYMEIFHYCMKNTQGIRRPGSAAADLAYVAMGRYEAFYEYGLNAWDVAAGAFLVRQAGGAVTDFSGQGDFIFGKEIIASNPGVQQEFLKLVGGKMGS